MEFDLFFKCIVLFLSDTNFSLIQYGLLIVFRDRSALSQNKLRNSFYGIK